MTKNPSTLYNSESNAARVARVARMPLYMGLARRLGESLQRGQWQAEGALPSERVLAEVLEVSRETARKALGLLCRRGLLVRVRGSGTYRAEPRAASLAAKPMAELHESQSQQGQRVIELGLAPASPAEQQAFGLAPGQLTWRVLTLQFGATAGAPALGLTQRSVPRHCLPSNLASSDIRPADLDASLQALGLGGVFRYQRIEAVAATGLQAAQIGVAPGTALLHVQRSRFGAMGQVLEIEHSWRLGVDSGLWLELCMSGVRPCTGITP